jgi:hypothetical protein
VLRGGYGPAMRAPEPIAVIAADLLQACRAVPSLVLEHGRANLERARCVPCSCGPDSLREWEHEVSR